MIILSVEGEEDQLKTLVSAIPGLKARSQEVLRKVALPSTQILVDEEKRSYIVIRAKDFDGITQAIRSLKKTEARQAPIHDAYLATLRNTDYAALRLLTGPTLDRRTGTTGDELETALVPASRAKTSGLLVSAVQETSAAVALSFETQLSAGVITARDDAKVESLVTERALEVRIEAALSLRMSRIGRGNDLPDPA